MLSCDHIESAIYLHGTLSLAKLVYYIMNLTISSPGISKYQDRLEL